MKVASRTLYRYFKHKNGTVYKLKSISNNQIYYCISCQNLKRKQEIMIYLPRNEEFLACSIVSFTSIDLFDFNKTTNFGIYIGNFEEYDNYVDRQDFLESLYIADELTKKYDLRVLLNYDSYDKMIKEVDDSIKELFIFDEHYKNEELFIFIKLNYEKFDDFLFCNQCVKKILSTRTTNKYLKKIKISNFDDDNDDFLEYIFNNYLSELDMPLKEKYQLLELIFDRLVNHYLKNECKIFDNHFLSGLAYLVDKFDYLSC